jgi:glycosyltransferase involved in cell wall biosynthesis
MLQIADAVTVLTKKHLELNRQLDSVKNRNIPMDVVPCCVDMQRFYYDAAKRDAIRRELKIADKFILMYPGKIGTFYLMEEMLDFYSRLLKTVPDALFLILTNDDVDSLLRMAKAKGLEDKIKIISGLGFDQMPRYIRAADAGIFFINPYKKIGSSPIKMGEFLASGIPVIINPGVGDTEEIVSENNVGVIVREFNKDAYEDAARQLLMLKDSDENLRSRCVDTAKRHLSLDRGAEKYFNIYTQLTPR